MLDSPGKRMGDSWKRQTSLATAALFGVNDSSTPQLEELNRTTHDLCITAHNLWISWVSDELSVILSQDLMQDDSLSATAPLRVTGIYGDFPSTEEVHGSQVSEKGVLQVLLDLKFAADVLSGGDPSGSEEQSKTPKVKSTFRRRQDSVHQIKSGIRKRVDGLVNCLTQRLDPIDWLTFKIAEFVEGTCR